MRFLFSVCICLLWSTAISAAPPKWFSSNMQSLVGTWVTSNQAYKNENEPFEQYVLEWQWGVGKQSIQGTLYGVENDKKVAFWDFRQYWDYQKNQGILVQYGINGTMGIGAMYLEDDKAIKIQQAFTDPTGKTTQEGHLSTLNNNEQTTTSYSISTDNQWNKKRTYIWHKN